MEVTLEEVDPGSGEDAFAAWAEVLLASLPYALATAESVRHESAHHRHLLARADGEPVGVARARPGSGDAPAFLTVAVRPPARGQGVGSTLAREALRRLAGLGGDEDRVLAVVEPDEHSAAVAAHWGFSGDRLGRVARVDATTVPGALAEPPPGYRILPGSQADPHAVWEVFDEVTLDDPSGLGRRWPFEEWVRDHWNDVLHRPDLSHVALTDEGRVASFTLLDAALDRGWSGMSGTARAHRGRGLALAVKAAMLRAAAQAGVRWCGTANDSENLPMVAVNTRLGYAEVARVRLVSRDLDRVDRADEADGVDGADGRS